LNGLFFFSAVFVLQACALTLATGWALVIAIPCALGIGIAAFRSSDAGLGLLFGFITISGFIGNLFSSAPVVSLTLLALAGWFVGCHARWMRHPGERVSFPGSRAMLVFLGWLLFSELFAVGQYWGVMPHWSRTVVVLWYGKQVTLGHAFGWIMLGYLGWSGGILFVLHAYRIVQDSARRSAWFVWMRYGAVAAVAAGIIQRFWAIGFANTQQQMHGMRVPATFYDPNVLAYFLLIAMPLLLVSRAAAAGRPRRMYDGLLFVGLVFLLLQSGSRTALAGIAGIGLGLTFLHARAVAEYVRAHWQVVFLTAAGCAVIALFLPGSTFGRLGPLFHSERLVDLVAERVPYWMAGLGIIKEHPFAGVGVGRYLLVLPEFLRMHALTLHTPNESACNLFLQIWAETGLPGLLLFVWVMARSGITAWKSVRETEVFGSIAGMIVIVLIVLSLFGNHIAVPELAVLFWFCAAYVAQCCAASQAARAAGG